MQSIKNTSIGIMLLFLSYGVYQVIMKPMPTGHSQTAAEDELLSVSDPIDFADASNSTGSPEKPLGSNDLIPPELLELKTPLAIQAPAKSGAQGMAKTPFDAPIASAFESEGDKIRQPTDGNLHSPSADRTSYPLSSPSDLAAEEYGSDQNSFEQEQATTNLQQIAVEADTRGIAGDPKQLDSDAEILVTSGMTDVVARPGSVSEQNHSANPDDQPLSPDPTTATLEQSWPQIDHLVDRGEFQSALRLLSQFYRAENLADTDRQQMLDWLDALAAKVVYSSEHHLRSVPYIIQPGDTIVSLARKWQIPAQLIYNVNISKIPDPNQLTAGVEIKLIQGPFDAEVNSRNQTMTLFLDGMYAGRFDIRATPALSAGEYSIVDKSAGGQAERPWWISLSNGASMFAASDAPPTQDAAIALKPDDAEDVFSILSASSTVRVLR